MISRQRNRTPILSIALARCQRDAKGFFGNVKGNVFCADIIIDQRLNLRMRTMVQTRMECPLYDNHWGTQHSKGQFLRASARGNITHTVQDPNNPYLSVGTMKSCVIHEAPWGFW